MRWERLFDDLEAQLDAENVREQSLEIADRTRRERALVGLHERFVGHQGLRIELAVLGGHHVAGEVGAVGDGWVLLRESSTSAALVPLAAVVRVKGLTGQAAAGRAVTSSKRFGLGYALRGLSRDRATVVVGDVLGSTVTGTIDAVGADSVEITEHSGDLPRRPENVVGTCVLAVRAIAVVRSR